MGDRSSWIRVAGASICCVEAGFTVCAACFRLTTVWSGLCLNARAMRFWSICGAEPHHYRPVSVGQQSFCRDETGNLTLQIQFYDIIS